ncbi:hypothetical protein N2152v2_007563 [Parachlorella kessleri]
MGACTSRPEDSPSLASDKEGPTSNKGATPAEKAIRGETQRALSVKVNDEVDDAVGSAEDSPEFVALKVLEKIGLGLQFSEGDPFIGQLVLDITGITGLTTTVPRPYVVVAGEDDKSQPREGTSGEGGSIAFEGAKFVFFVCFSNTTFDISLKGRKGPTKVPYGKAHLPVSILAQGSQSVELDILSEKGAKIGTLKATADYRWLRGTQDDGRHTVVNRLIVNRAGRGMRKTMRVGLAAIELISQVNHWILSHDNVWRVLPGDDDGGKGEQQEGDTSVTTASASGAQTPEEGEADEAATRELVDAVAGHKDLQLQEGDAASQLQCSINMSAQRGATAEQRLAQDFLLEALGPKETDGSDVAQLKRTLLMVVSPLVERVGDLDTRLTTLTRAVQRHQLLSADAPSTGDGAAAEGRGPGPAKAKELTKAVAAAEVAIAGEGEGSETSGGTSPLVMPFVSGHFEYGLGRAAGKRNVFMFMRKAHLAGSPVMLPEFLGTHKTRKNGDLGPITLPPTICKTPGHYEFVSLLPDDYTSAKGSLFILKPGTKAVVFDMDGTITVGDSQVVTQFAMDALGASTALNSHLSHKYDLLPRRHALHVVRAWAAKGYQPIYLSGRQGRQAPGCTYFNLTLSWLIKHRYPPGPIHLTRTHMPTLPVYFSVGLFKVKYMESLKEKGIEIYAAYGNTPTDVKAYAAAGVPKERTYMIGPHAGKGGTVKIDNFTDHLLQVLEHPDSDVPIPYTELLMTERPGYYRKKKVKGADGITHEVSRVTSLGVAASELGLDEDSEGHTRLEHLDDFESEELEDEVGAGGQLEEPKLAPVEEEPRSSGYP